jgi:hypothetical protein
VRTTRVSNPVRSPHFRASASIVPLPAAFAIDLLCNIYAFHRYFTHSAGIIHIQAHQSRRQAPCLACCFHRRLDRPPTHPLNPINPDNARIPRITAAAGTELADAYSCGTLIGPLVDLIAPALKQFTIHRTFFLHAAWLDQISIHCPIFLTAASRRSLDRVSVPVWGVNLSVPLNIVAMVSRYLSI